MFTRDNRRSTGLVSKSWTQQCRRGVGWGVLALWLDVWAVAHAVGAVEGGTSAVPVFDTGKPTETEGIAGRDTIVPADTLRLAEMNDSEAVRTRDSPFGGAGVFSRMKKDVRVISPFVRWIRRHWVRLFLSAVAVAVIWISISCVSARREQERFLTTTRLSIMDKEVQRACRLVEKDYADPGLTPQSLCARLVTGESFLESLFERELGMSVAEFIEQVRINRVRQLLRLNPLVPAGELAAATGFGSADDLVRAFERVVATGIEQYRAALQAGDEPAA